jgi:hypothetical protein
MPEKAETWEVPKWRPLHVVDGDLMMYLRAARYDIYTDLQKRGGVNCVPWTHSSNQLIFIYKDKDHKRQTKFDFTLYHFFHSVVMPLFS